MNKFKMPLIKTKLIKKIFDFDEDDYKFYQFECGIDNKILHEIKGKLVTVVLNEDENDVSNDFFEIIKYRKLKEPIRLEVWGGHLKSYIKKTSRT